MWNESQKRAIDLQWLRRETKTATLLAMTMALTTHAAIWRAPVIKICCKFVEDEDRDLYWCDGDNLEVDKRG